MKLPFDKIYFLAYSDDPRRTYNVYKQIKNLALLPDQYVINYTSFFPYAEMCGKALLPADYERLDWIRYKNSFAGVFNCVSEHYKMIRSAYNLCYKKILVCEDDVNFIDNYNLIEDTFNRLPDKFGIVKFYHTDYKQTTDDFVLRPVTGYNDGVKSTLCYALDRDGMKSYMRSFEKSFRPADDVFEGCLDVLKTCTGPLICSPANLPSNIESF